MIADLISVTLVRIIKGFIRGTQKDHFDAFRKEVLETPALQEAVLSYAFKNRYLLARDGVVEFAENDVRTVTPAKRGAAPAAHASPSPVGQRPRVVSSTSNIPPAYRPTAAPYKPQVRPSVAGIIDQLRKVVLMEYALPNGTKVKDASFGELRAYGGWLHEVGMSHPANQIVGHYLTEANLHDFVRRVAA